MTETCARHGLFYDLPCSQCKYEQEHPSYVAPSIASEYAPMTESTPTFIDRTDGRYECRPYTTGYSQSERNGRSTLTIYCPFCGERWDVSLWSFAGSGKRCSCGAKMSLRGGAWKKVTP